MADEANASTDTTDTAAQATTETVAAEGKTNVADALHGDQGKAADADAGKTDATEEGKADEGKKDGGEGDDAHEALTLKAPEGAEAYQGEFDKFATDMDGWLKDNPEATAREALQEAANRQARMAGESQGAVQQALEERNSNVEAWEKSLRDDPDFGGEKFDANAALYKKAAEANFDKFGLQQLESSGLGSHPFIVRALFAAGKEMADTPIANGRTGTSTRGNFATALYDGNGKG